jgi:hypothetical protein
VVRVSDPQSVVNDQNRFPAGRKLVRNAVRAVHSLWEGGPPYCFCGSGNRDQGIEIRDHGDRELCEGLEMDSRPFPVSFFLTVKHVPAGTLRDEGKRFPGWGIYPESTVTLHSRGN